MNGIYFVMFLNINSMERVISSFELLDNIGTIIITATELDDYLH